MNIIGGVAKTVNKIQGDFKLKCLKTYSKSHYSFKNCDKEHERDVKRKRHF